jgi:cation transport ATPase
VTEELDRIAALERAETRLDAHARQRSLWRARRARRRALRAWLLALLIVPAAAAAGFVTVLETAGGDLGAWTSASAAALVIGALLGPAALSGWLARSLGRYQASALALITLLIEVTFVFGVAFLALGYGPPR